MPTRSFVRLQQHKSHSSPESHAQPRAALSLAAGMRSPIPGHKHRLRPGISRGFAVQRHQAIVGIVLQASDHGGHATQCGLRADAGGFAQGDELRRDVDEQDVGLLQHDGIP